MTQSSLDCPSVALHNFGKGLHPLQFVNGRALRFFHHFKMRRGKSCHLFELTAEMPQTAVVELKSDFTQSQFVIHQQLFHPFNFLGNVEVLNADPFHFAEQVAEVVVIHEEEFRQKDRKIRLDLIVLVMNQVDNRVFHALDYSAFFTVNQLKTKY